MDELSALGREFSRSPSWGCLERVAAALSRSGDTLERVVMRRLDADCAVDRLRGSAAKRPPLEPAIQEDRGILFAESVRLMLRELLVRPRLPGARIPDLRRDELAREPEDPIAGWVDEKLSVSVLWLRRFDDNLSGWYSGDVRAGRERHLDVAASGWWWRDIVPNAMAAVDRERGSVTIGIRVDDPVEWREGRPREPWHRKEEDIAFRPWGDVTSDYAESLGYDPRTGRAKAGDRAGEKWPATIVEDAHRAWARTSCERRFRVPQVVAAAWATMSLTPGSGSPPPATPS